METSLTASEQEELVRLLKIIADEDKGFIPDPAYRAMHKLVPWPAVEVLIYDKGGRFLLSYRDDDFKGWHIPGGYMRPGESYQEACNRHVRKEKIADRVTNLQLIASHVWLEGEHPMGYPVSLIFSCLTVGVDEVTERDDLKWFSEIPTNTIPENHPSFLAYFQKWFKGGERSAAIL